MPQSETASLTFLFTDVEGSTRHWETKPSAMADALALHDDILRRAIEQHHGSVFKTVGDGFYAMFPSPIDAVAAAIRIQRALQAAAWGETGRLMVRVALHTGEAQRRAGDYFGPSLNRVARLMSAGHGGQVLLSRSTADEVRESLPRAASLRDLGERRLKDLPRPEHVYQLVVEGLPDAFPPLRTLDRQPNNLPAQLTSLVGRRREAATARRLLQREDVRLLTLIGPGGIGKTRLSLRVGLDLLDDFTDGVFFVPLAAISDPQLVESATAQVLGVENRPGESLHESLVAYLRDRQTLLILDNFEQVVAAAPLVSELLAAAPALKVLVTTRELLDISPEHCYEVPPLGVPDLRKLPPLESLTDYDAVRLFVERAIARLSTFELTQDNARAIAEICGRLDGLPLALELAAARIRTLSPEQILAGLSSRLALLTQGPRDLPARQQTLRNAIAWSYDLLSDDERRWFERVSVFAGGCTVEAAAYVCDGGLLAAGQADDALRSLVDQSLLRVDEVEGERRYTMLQTLQEYGQESLEASGEATMRRRRHAEHFERVATGAEPHLSGGDQAEWLARLSAEHDNLRGALSWALESGDGDLALAVAVSLSRFWAVRGHFEEGRQWLERALAAVGKAEQAPTIRQAHAFRGLGNLAWRQCHYEASEDYHERALAIYRELGERFWVAAGLNNLSNPVCYRGDYERARRLLEEALAIFRELHAESFVAVTLTNLGVAVEALEEYERAQTLYVLSLEICRRLGDESRIALNLHNLAYLALRRGDPGLALTHASESLEINRRLDDSRNAAYALGLLGEVSLEEGGLSLAEAQLLESLRAHTEVGDRRGTVQALDRFARLMLMWGRLEEAARLLGAVEAGWRSSKTVPPPAERQAHDRTIDQVHHGLGDARLLAAMREGEAMTIEETAGRVLTDGPSSSDQSRRSPEAMDSEHWA